MNRILSTLLESLGGGVGKASRVRFFPVRHYSPTSARMVRELIEREGPVAVLIEGPADYNDQLEELGLGHTLPIALYSYVRYSDNTRGSAFYPFCEFSPEWQALEGAKALGVPVRFIDMPWHEVAAHSDQKHRYADRSHEHNVYVEALCERLEVEDFDEAWDVLFELDATLDPRGYLERAYHFMVQLRLMSPGVTFEDELREGYMAREVAEALERHGDGVILVVTGGFHTPALLARLMGFGRDELTLTNVELPEEEALESPGEEAQVGEEAPKVAVDWGVTLTPFTYDRIDRMSGYQSGVHGPAFYEYAWHTRRAGEVLDGRPLLYEAFERLRAKGQILSTADAIAVETTAWALASMRGRREVWRYDLLDALSAAVIKEAQESHYEHPMLQEVRDVFCGDKRGVIDPQASLPPLVSKAREALERLGLTPQSKGKTLRLELLGAKDLEQSRVLHRCRTLEIAGFILQEQTDLVGRADMTRPMERWRLEWSPHHEASLIEASVYGADLGEAAFAKVLELANATTHDAERAALLLIDAALMGLEHSMSQFYDRLLEMVRKDTDFFKLTRALDHLLYLYAFDAVFGAKDSGFIGLVLAEAYQRALWLFEGLGVVRDRDRELMEAIGAIFYTFRRCEDESFVDRENFIELFERVSDDTHQMPMVRGATLGALYAMHRAPMPAVLDLIRYFHDPLLLSDFLVGLFSLAREAAQRDARLLQMLDARLMGLNEEEFWATAPGFRLAFTFFTPREKTQLIAILFPDTQEPEDAIPGITAGTWHEARDFSHRVIQTLVRFGVRTPRRSPSLEGAATTRYQVAHESAHQPLLDVVEMLPGEHEDKSSTTPSMEPAEDPPTYSQAERMQRWKVVLGIGAESMRCELPSGWAERERAMGFLYDREYGQGRNIRGGRQGSGSAESTMSVPEWINEVHTLFPRRVIERLERDALERYNLEELVTRPELLERVKPNMTLMKAVLRTKHLMNQEVLGLAKRLVKQVVKELMETFAREVTSPFAGAANRRHRSFVKVAKNFDAHETIRRNLKHWDAQEEALVIKDPCFFSRTHRHIDRWQLIVVVDESGSMIDSVIHAAVCASIFWGIKALKTNLVIFDTQVVDLTDQCEDPVETLMKVQLGGGTDIALAMRYVAGLVETPRRTIVVLITDFFEGGNRADLIQTTKELVEGGTHVLGLAALDGEANPTYDRDLAQMLSNQGAHIGAMTPGELAAWVSDIVT